MKKNKVMAGKKKGLFSKWVKKQAWRGAKSGARLAGRGAVGGARRAGEFVEGKRSPYGSKFKGFE